MNITDPNTVGFSPSHMVVKYNFENQIWEVSNQQKTDRLRANFSFYSLFSKPAVLLISSQCVVRVKLFLDLKE